MVVNRQSKQSSIRAKRPDIKKIDGNPFRLWDRYQDEQAAEKEGQRLKRKWRNTVVPGKPGRVVATGGVRYRVILNMSKYPPVELWVWFHPTSKLTRATGHKKVR